MWDYICHLITLPIKKHIPTPPIILFPIMLPGALARDACKAYSPVAAKAVLPITLHVKQSFSKGNCWVVGDVGTGNVSRSFFMTLFEVGGGRTFLLCNTNNGVGDREFLVNGT